ncbi:hypothetical protein F5J12DRAFT_784327 [Pisolithus orientalis]|uniref:uncharacterized protein n=1 Tax=Pisolithus orientalis TaxID=936130 RepID=UPI0022258C14|nr:uncharacterized protein F5J12DRAFT_784327 [Pisolithus orientalis]KAI6000293.1 hypothetical protein F5J12DRAFT_784327 [Pisolithus orientalis]
MASRWKQWSMSIFSFLRGSTGSEVFRLYTVWGNTSWQRVPRERCTTSNVSIPATEYRVVGGWESLNVPTIGKASSSSSSDHASRRLALAMLPPGILVNFLFRMWRYPGSFLIATTFMSPNRTLAKRFYVCASYELDQYSSSVYIQKTVVTRNCKGGNTETQGNETNVGQYRKQEKERGKQMAELTYTSTRERG